MSEETNPAGSSPESGAGGRAGDAANETPPPTTTSKSASSQSLAGYGIPSTPLIVGDGDGAPAGDGNGHAENGHASENGGSNGHSNGNGSDRPGVRPVKVRMGAPDQANHANGGSAASVTGGFRGSVAAARVAPAAGSIPSPQVTTSHLRESDITGLRLKLKREEWTRESTRRDADRRVLPFFLMRHRSIRSTARVGNTRIQVANRRYGSTGPVGIFVRVFAVLMVLGLGMGIAGVGGGVIAAAQYVGDLPPVDGAGALHGLQAQTTKIYDRNGIPLYDIVDEQSGLRREVPLDQVSPLVISATVATEDATFWTNPGIDAVAIARALNINFGGKGSSGASTITQQLVREVNLPPGEGTDVSYRRKLREAIQAVRFTQTYTKRDIMEMYLNENYYGHRAYGIEGASLTYFGHSARDLTLPEAALLAGMPQAPTQYDPFVNPDLAKRRQAIVLDLMVKQNMITQEQADAAKAETLVLRPYQPVLKAPHFVYYVKDYLEKLYGPDASNLGLVVTTTLDLRVQDAAEKVAKDRIDQLRQQNATNAAIVVMKPGTGEILAMVGSVDYNDKSIDGQVNVATRERQPGSSFKPITYVTAFAKGWTPGTVILDTLTSFPNPGQQPYIPKNYDGRDHGWVTAREALGNSYNIPAVKTIQFAGLQNVIDTAHAMGIKGLNRGTDWYGLSLTLGGGEVTLLDMTNAYSTFANSGVEVDANPILAIQDPQGRIIKSLNPNARAAGNQAIDPRYAYMITSILTDNRARSAAFGVSNPLHMPFTAAAKTGTTNDNRDSWTLGYTPNLTVGVWVGNSNNAEMSNVTGAIGAAVIWHNMMQAFYDNPDFVDLVRGPDGKLQTEFTEPAGLMMASACSAKGQIYDLFLTDSPPKGCTTYKDKNQQLRSLPTAPTRPAVRPTPLPGIWPPLNPNP